MYLKLKYVTYKFCHVVFSFYLFLQVNVELINSNNIFETPADVSLSVFLVISSQVSGF